MSKYANEQMSKAKRRPALASAEDGNEEIGFPRIPFHVSPFGFAQGKLITFHVSRFTFHASRIALAIGAFLHLLTASTDAAFLDKAGVRPLGMGGAFVARADDSSAGLWNPAGLAQLKQSEFVATYSALYTGLGEDNLGR
ncbi:hypothetical protein HYR99_21000, partial [Candidatus Poribacteria bacterium]|nr:hypothetical protein [Candidatus Poribacteria bacterium]